jgi:cell division protein FtsI/penicillin-binding protein 2
MALLLHRSLIIARKAANPFVFYLTAGIAIVTAIQFLVIAAGCFGVMPLTGITVPFLSYGKVSMIISIAAFGLVLAASSLTGDVRQAAYIEKTYDNTITFGALSFVMATIGFAGLFLFYQIIKPDQYIVKPAVVVTKTGERFVSVNPRISLLMGKLTAGNIYDRNGLLLATADKNAMLQAKAGIVAVGVGDSIIDRQSFIKQKRYYPFGNNMFFWTGDYNSRLYWNNNAKGYFAESRHLTLLRGFNTAPKGADSVKYYRSGKYQPEQFLPAQKDSFKLALYNYEAMIPFLKAGIYSNKVDSFNKIKKDITLTVDAELQTRIQNSVRLYLDSLGTIQPEVKGWRTSVVVLDAATGEVYSSAVCPLPDYSVLKKLSLLDSAGQRTAINRLTLGDDSMFTDADLGVTFPTAPGSTAKIMSAIAGLNKAGMRADTTYNILSSEIIRKSGNDPDPTGKVDMQYAIIHSSNVYFIRLVNDFKLDNQMADVYQAAGVSVANRGNHGFENLYDPVAWSVIRKRWAKVFNDKSRRVYYNQPTGDEKKDRDRLKSEFSGLAWGQGQMTATPLAMARVTGSVANHGVMQSAKYLFKSSLPAPVQRDSAITVTSGTNADFIAHCMHEQVATKNIADALKIDIAGKTGTPERGVFGNDKNYDGWFMFFIQSAKTKHPMAVCIRIEKAQGSGQAVRMAQHAVIPVLEQLHYLETGH